MTKVIVTQEIIDTALPVSIDRCIFALALAPHLEGLDWGVGYHHLYVLREDEKTQRIHFPTEVCHHQNDFDAKKYGDTKPVKPFSFEIDLSPLFEKE